jgi:protein SDA1
MTSALRYLLGYDQAVEEEDEDNSSDDEDDDTSKKTGISGVTKEEIYKAHKKGTTSSKRKKQAKLERVMRSLAKQQRNKSREMDHGSHAPLQHVHDPQNFAEKLFSRLEGRLGKAEGRFERFEVKLMMMQVISRVVGMHKLILLNFYPYLQRYIQPHQRDVTQLLAAAVQSCHDDVPPDAVESMIRQLVNQFVHDRARPEVMAVGLNVVREICMRIPLIMTKELLTDLALYKKSREKAVSAAARSIISVYRQVFPALLDKKDRGRGADLALQPKAFGEKRISEGIEGVELLLDGESGSDEDEDGDEEHDGSEESDDAMEGDDAVESDEEDGSELIEDEEMGSDGEADDSDEAGGSDLEELEEDSDSEEINDEDESGKISRKRPLESEVTEGDDDAGPSTSQKRQKLESSVIEEAANTSQSLRHLKKMYAAKVEKKVVTEVVSRDGDGILSNEDFKRIRDLQAKRAAKAAMAEHGLSKAGKFRQEIAVKLDKHGNLNEKRVNPAHLEARIHKRQEKEERQASARAGREDRPLFGARTAMKQRKTGGTSNKQKEKSKGMPLAAKRAIIKRTSSKKKMGRRTAEKQFRGKKAWK